MTGRMPTSCLVLALLIALAATTAHCQAPPGAPGAPVGPGAGGGGGVGMPGGPGMGMPGMGNPDAMRMMMRNQSVPAIAVAEGFVFVVYAGTLFQFTVDGLKEVASAPLSPARDDRPGRGGRARGDRNPAKPDAVKPEAGAAAPGLPNPEP